MTSLHPLIDIQALQRILSETELLLLDTRGSLTESESGKALFRTSHIPGAQWIDFMEDIAGERTDKNGRTPIANREKLAAKLRSFGLNRNGRVVVYDNGKLNLAPRVWFTLRWIGLADVQVLTGGFKAWEDAGFPLESETKTKPLGDFVAKTPLERIVTTPEVEIMLETRSHLLVDARDTQTFAGEVTLDAKSGHIPGSVCSPSAANIDSEGRWIDSEALRQKFLTLSQGQPERIVHTCGSGVAACLNHLAIRAIGLEDAGVYIGSFSEWIRNPNHPTATGI